MLPFLKNKIRQNNETTVVERESDTPDESGADIALQAAMKDLLRAKDSGNIKDMARAFRAAFQILELEPHEEISHESE